MQRRGAVGRPSGFVMRTEAMTDTVPATAPPPTEAERLFELDGVGKFFGRAEVLKDITFSIREGERIAVIGPSGAGKTTLFRLLCAVLWPSSGRVVAFGNDTSRLRGRALRALRRRIGILYQ